MAWVGSKETYGWPILARMGRLGGLEVEEVEVVGASGALWALPTPMAVEGAVGVQAVLGARVAVVVEAEVLPLACSSWVAVSLWKEMS